MFFERFVCFRFSSLWMNSKSQMTLCGLVSFILTSEISIKVLKDYFVSNVGSFCLWNLVPDGIKYTSTFQQGISRIFFFIINLQFIRNRCFTYAIINSCFINCSIERWSKFSTLIVGPRLVHSLWVTRLLIRIVVAKWVASRSVESHTLPHWITVFAIVVLLIHVLYVIKPFLR